MKPKWLSQRGFTLVELMIVVVIIGLLAGLALPRFWQATGRTRQSEAKIILKLVLSMQLVYRQDSPTNSYFITGQVASAANPTAFQALGFEIPPTSEYSYTIILAPNGVDYEARASTNLDDDALLDIWRMGPDGVLVNESDDITNTVVP